MDRWLRDLLRDLAKGLDGQNLDQLWAEYLADTAAHALPTWMALFGQRVWAECRTCLAHHDAQEVFTDTFLKLDEKKKTIRAYKAVGSWLEKTAWHLARNRHRRNRRRATVALPADTVAAGGSAEAEFINREAVAAALSRMPERQRRALTLIYRDGRTREEAADAVGVQPDTVSCWVSRLKKAAPAAAVGTGATTASRWAWALDPLPAGLFARTARAAATPRPVVAPVGIGWATKAKGLVAALMAGVVAIGVAGSGQWAESPRPIETKSPLEKEETLEAQNLRVLRTKVIPELLKELRAIPGAGDVRAVSSDAYDTRVEVVIEGPLVKALSYDAAKPYRARLLYDTADDYRCLQIVFHQDGRFTTVDAARPLTLPALLPFRFQEVEVGLPALDRAWDAFKRIEPERRMVQESRKRDDDLCRAMHPWIGTWAVQGQDQAVGLRFVKWDRRFGFRITGPGWDRDHVYGSPAGRAGPIEGYRTFCGLGGRFRVNDEGTRVEGEIPGVAAKQVWLRPEIVAAGEALKPTSELDLTGIWVPKDGLNGLFIILHRPNGRIEVVHESGSRTWAALNSKRELHTATSAEMTANRGVVNAGGGQIAWDSPDGVRRWWERRPHQPGNLTGIWYRDEKQELACAIVEPPGNESLKHLRLIDEWGRQTAAILADNVVRTESGPERGRTLGSLAKDRNQLIWAAGTVWSQRANVRDGYDDNAPSSLERRLVSLS